LVCTCHLQVLLFLHRSWQRWQGRSRCYSIQILSPRVVHENVLQAGQCICVIHKLAGSSLAVLLCGGKVVAGKTRNVNAGGCFGEGGGGGNGGSVTILGPPSVLSQPWDRCINSSPGRKGDNGQYGKPGIPGSDGPQGRHGQA
jgi:hypothetical protein